MLPTLHIADPEPPWINGPPEGPVSRELGDYDRDEILAWINAATWDNIVETVNAIERILTNALDPESDPYDERAEPEYWED